MVICDRIDYFLVGGQRSREIEVGGGSRPPLKEVGVTPAPTPLLYTLSHAKLRNTAYLRWEFIKENKRVRKKERKHALDQETDQENDQEKKKAFPFVLDHFVLFSFFFLNRFLGRKRVFLFSFINSHLILSIHINSHLWCRTSSPRIIGCDGQAW